MARQIILTRIRRGRRKSCVRAGSLPMLVFFGVCLFGAVVGALLERAVLGFKSGRAPVILSGKRN